MALFVGITGLISVLVGWLVTSRLIMTNEGALFFAIGSIGMVIGITALGRFPRVAFRPDVAGAKFLSLAITLGGGSPFSCLTPVEFMSSGPTAIPRRPQSKLDAPGLP